MQSISQLECSLIIQPITHIFVLMNDLSINIPSVRKSKKHSFKKQA